VSSTIYDAATDSAIDNTHSPKAVAGVTEEVKNRSDIGKGVYKTDVLLCQVTAILSYMATQAGPFFKYLLYLKLICTGQASSLSM